MTEPRFQCIFIKNLSSARIRIRLPNEDITLERRPLYNPIAEKDAPQRRASVGRAVLNGLLVVAALLFLGASYYLRILPLKYLAIVALLAVLLLITGFLFRSRVGKIVILVWILLLSGGMFYVQSQINALIVTRDSETVISVFLVKNESPMQELSDLSGQDIGFSAHMPENVKEQVQNQLWEAASRRGRIRKRGTTSCF